MAGCDGELLIFLRGSRARHFPLLPVREKLLKHGSSERGMYPRPGDAATRRAGETRGTYKRVTCLVV